MITAEKIQAMLELQDKLEVLINGPDWTSKTNHDYVLAMVLEISEAIEKTDWKWWKDTEFDVEAVRMELVDVLHFFLAFSLFHTKDHTVEELSVELAAIWNQGSAFTSKKNIVPFVDYALSLMHTLLHEKTFNLYDYTGMCKSVELNFDALHRMYIGKNILNIFRIEHGYGDGNYAKLWNVDGREDNEHLADLLDNDSDISYDALYSALEARYAMTP